MATTPNLKPGAALVKSRYIVPAVLASASSQERASAGHLFGVYVPILCLLLACSSGCGAKGDDPHGLPPQPGAGPPPLGEGLPLPFVVDDHFHPSGCYALEGCPVTIDTRCETRAEGAQGQCYRFNFVEGQTFAGVFFQNVDEVGAGNWGQAPGTLIVPGARDVSFYASSNNPGQVVMFKVGGISDPELAYADTLDIEFMATLDTTLQRFSIPLEGATYQEVLSAFSWHVERPADQSGNIELILDDVRWE